MSEFDNVNTVDEGYVEENWTEGVRTHVPPSEMPIISQDFLDELREDGVPESELGHFAAELAASNTDADGNVNAWQTFCNKLQYPEGMLPPSEGQREARREVQAEADQAVNDQLRSYKFLGDLNLIPYQWKIDLYIQKMELEGEGFDSSEVEEKIRTNFGKHLEKVISRKNMKQKRGSRFT